MLKFEKKMIDLINRYMLHIALAFIVFSALWMRLAGRNYIGLDFHYSLYDIPGNCNPVLHRTLAAFLMSFPDLSVVLFKLLAYAGDFAVALITLLLLYKPGQKITDLRTFFICTACLLSPVVLIYSIGAMRTDSICMSLLLFGMYLYQRSKKLLPAIPPMVLAAFFQTTYWPIIIAVVIFIAIGKAKEQHHDKSTAIALLSLLLCFILSIMVENHGDTNVFFWGKVFLINPLTATAYEDSGKWLSSMLNIYGYTLATGSLIISLKYRKMRLPALIIQVFILFFAGWQMTSHLAI